MLGTQSSGFVLILIWCLGMFAEFDLSHNGGIVALYSDLLGHSLVCGGVRVWHMGVFSCLVSGFCRLVVATSF